MADTNKIQQILVPVWGRKLPQKAIESALVLSKGFDKPITVCAMKGQELDCADNYQYITIEQAQQQGSARLKLDNMVEKVDAVIVVLSDEENISIKQQLSMCRNLRIPYLFVQKAGNVLDQIKRILVPVGFLVEEKEKGPLSNSFGRFFGSDIVLLEPNDKGSKARQNLFFLRKLLDGYKQEYIIKKGKKSSFGIEKEAIALAQAEMAEMVFIMASREYGLDDMFFGPKEYHVLKKAKLPVMVLNPRDDIYVLCGS